MPLPDDIRLVIEPAKDYLNRRQVEDYKQHRHEVLGWLWTVGKDPERGEGYSKSVTRNMTYRLSKIYRWVWDREDRYTTEITHEHADDYLREIAGEDWKKFQQVAVSQGAEEALQVANSQRWWGTVGAGNYVLPFIGRVPATGLPHA